MREKTKATTSTSSQRSTSQRARRNRDSYVDQFEQPPMHSRQHRAEVVGHTRDGRLVVRLSSGRVIVLPRVNGQDYPSHPRRRAYVERPDDYEPPLQPFDPND